MYLEQKHFRTENGKWGSICYNTASTKEQETTQTDQENKHPE